MAGPSSDSTLSAIPEAGRSPADIDSGRRGVLMKRATYASVVTACLLVAVKLVAWVMTDSVSLLSSLVDSSTDALASLLNLLAVRHALQPADRDHRFGHGKAEPLAGLGQAAFIVGSSVFLVIEVVTRLVNPQPVAQEMTGIAVMLFSILATLVLVGYQRHVIRQTASVAISADSLHYVGDVLVNASVVVSLILSARYGFERADPLFGAGVACIILYSAWTITRESFGLLMDKEFPAEDRDRIRTIALSHPDVRSMHDLRTRSSGHTRFVQLHLELDPYLTLLRAHQIADEVEINIRDAFPNCEVMIHEDPSGVEEDTDRNVVG